MIRPASAAFKFIFNSITNTTTNNILKSISQRIPSSVASIHQTAPKNAGHSKWTNIRHIKALKDGQRSAAFTKLSRQIRLAIQEGGANPTANSALKSAIEAALNKNMPMATIQNTIKKCEQSKMQLKRHILEIKAFQKIYFVCILYSDNLAQLKMNLAPIVRKSGGCFVDAQHLFDSRGVIEANLNEKTLNELSTKTEEKIEDICLEDAIECGAEEIEVTDPEKGTINFFCDPIELQRISDALLSKGYHIESAEHVFIPKVYVKISEDDLKAVDLFINKVRTLDGIDEVYDNIHPGVR